MSLLENGLETLGVPLEVSSKMETYINEIILFNSAYNLTNTSDHDELVIRHIFDSYAPYKIIKEKISQFGKNDLKGADIGSGGGLPGIPLAAAFPEISFSLVERMSKRCAFLENVSALTGLKNVTVINSEAEIIPEESFDFITFRAFRPLDKKMIKTLLRIVKNGGFLFAYKAKKENILEEMSGIKEFVSDYEMIQLSVPGLDDTERNLVVIKKTNLAC